MNRSRWSCVFFLLRVCDHVAVSAAEQRPNIVLIAADDLGFPTLNADQRHRRHIDSSLAMAFSGFRSSTTGAVCVPTRASLLRPSILPDRGVALPAEPG